MLRVTHNPDNLAVVGVPSGWIDLPADWTLVAEEVTRHRLINDCYLWRSLAICFDETPPYQEALSNRCEIARRNEVAPHDSILARGGGVAFNRDGSIVP